MSVIKYLIRVQDINFNQQIDMKTLTLRIVVVFLWIDSFLFMYFISFSDTASISQRSIDLPKNTPKHPRTPQNTQ